MISGAGSVVQAGTGTTILTAANTYSGGTTIAAGTLQLGNSGTTGSIVGDVLDNGTLAFERSDSVTFPGVISGAGSVIQAGTGTTILTAANTYSGAPRLPPERCSSVMAAPAAAWWATSWIARHSSSIAATL